jgi:hypothetical protein
LLGAAGLLAASHLPTKVRQQERFAAQMVDWNSHRQHSRLVDLPMLHQVRDTTIGLDGDLGHGSSLGSKDAVYLKEYCLLFDYPAFRRREKAKGFCRRRLPQPAF